MPSGYSCPTAVPEFPKRMSRTSSTDSGRRGATRASAARGWGSRSYAGSWERTVAACGWSEMPLVARRSICDFPWRPDGAFPSRVARTVCPHAGHVAQPLAPVGRNDQHRATAVPHELRAHASNDPALDAARPRAAGDDEIAVRPLGKSENGRSGRRGRFALQNDVIEGDAVV